MFSTTARVGTLSCPNISTYCAVAFVGLLSLNRTGTHSCVPTSPLQRLAGLAGGGRLDGLDINWSGPAAQRCFWNMQVLGMRLPPNALGAFGATLSCPKVSGRQQQGFWPCHPPPETLRVRRVSWGRQIVERSAGWQRGSTHALHHVDQREPLRSRDHHRP